MEFPAALIPAEGDLAHRGGAAGGLPFLRGRGEGQFESGFRGEASGCVGGDEIRILPAVGGLRDLQILAVERGERGGRAEEEETLARFGAEGDFHFTAQAVVLDDP